MPVLRAYVDRSGFYVITKIRGNVVTYQLSVDGAEKLRTAGVKPGDKFDRFMLLDLYQAGEAYTRHSGPGEIVSAHPGQGELDFTNDPEPEMVSTQLCKFLIEGQIRTYLPYFVTSPMRLHLY